MQSHMRKVHACLAVTFHLYFWQNDRGLLRDTVITRVGTDTEIRVSTPLINTYVPVYVAFVWDIPHVQSVSELLARGAV